MLASPGIPTSSTASGSKETSPAEPSITPRLGALAQWLHAVDSQAKVFVVSIGDAIGSIFFMLTTLKIAFGGISCEEDPDLSSFVQTHAPHVHTWDKASTISIDYIWSQFRSGQYTHMLVSANPDSFHPRAKPTDLDKPRFLEATLWTRTEVEKLCNENGIHFNFIITKRIDTDKATSDYITNATGSTPFIIHAADFGWIHQSLFVWTNSEPESFTNKLHHIKCHRAGQLSNSAHVIRYSGPPIPSQWNPQDRAVWSDRGNCGTKGPVASEDSWGPSYPTGRFLELQQCRRHSCMIESSPDPVVQAWYQSDFRRFPVATYILGNLVSKGDQLRQLNLHERSELMGYRPNITDNLTHRFAERIRNQSKFDAIAKAWHFPSLLLFVAILFIPMAKAVHIPTTQHIGQSIPRHMISPEASNLSESFPQSDAPDISRKFHWNRHQARILFWANSKLLCLQQADLLMTSHDDLGKMLQLSHRLASGLWPMASFTLP